MKPTVHYKYLAIEPNFIVVGESVVLFPVDHPDRENVSNEEWVRTSKVVAFDDATGTIETVNTIYVPAEEFVETMRWKP